LLSSTLSGPSLGTTYCFSSRARDLAGNVGAWSPAVCSTTPRDDRSLALRTPGWSRVNQPGYLASTYTATTRFGATLATPSSLTTRRIGLVAMRCPTCGSVAVYVGSSRVGTISLASRTTVARSQIALPAFTSVKSGVVRFVVTTRGRTVRIDSALFA
jgi:hypothetical protein